MDNKEVNHVWVDRIVFHFNKAHNQDQSIPQWVIKYRGETFYVNHLVSFIGFKTKETPDNPSTKGSIQFMGKLEIKEIDGEKTAYIS